VIKPLFVSSLSVLILRAVRKAPLFGGAIDVGTTVEETVEEVQAVVENVSQSLAQDWLPKLTIR
jgi:hypothetical protein